jgi:hypothetical protein
VGVEVHILKTERIYKKLYPFTGFDCVGEYDDLAARG